MIRLSAFYEWQEGAQFDFTYYQEAHLPMVLKLLQPYGMQRFEVERGVMMLDGAPPLYIAVGSLYFATLDGLQQGAAAHAAEILDDMKNYTRATLRLQIGDLG